jgi:hypothetical protein
MENFFDVHMHIFEGRIEPVIFLNICLIEQLEVLLVNLLVLMTIIIINHYHHLRILLGK